MSQTPIVRHLAVRPEWLAQVEEEALEPALPIIDPHHHLWERPGNVYHLADLLEDTSSGHDIRATVFIQCNAMFRLDGPEPFRCLGETDYVNGAAAQCASGIHGAIRACQAIVGNAELALGDDVAPVLEAHLRIAGDRFRGIRNNLAWHPDPGVRANPIKLRPGLMMDPQFRRGVARLREYALTLDLWVYHTQLDEVRDLVAAFPDTGFILDHVGGPIGMGPFQGCRADVFPVWREKIRSLAKYPNLEMKLGGLAMECAGFDFHLAPKPPGSAQLAAAWKPYIETCIEAFG
ncbi:MAG TPA: amidohydrolase family protein, partial [Roseomonas sp.]